MSQIADTTPVIIGVGQFAERPQDEGYRALSHMDLAGEALKAAIADTHASGDVAAAIDTIAAIPQFEISGPHASAPFGKTNNPPRSIGNRVGANPERAILEIVGGQGNQKMVGELATDIAEGRSDVAVVVGSEAISTVLTLSKAGKAPDWSEEVEGTLDFRGLGVDGMIEPTLGQHGVVNPIFAYALFDNARRAKLGLSLDDYRQKIGELFAPFTDVAAANPYAASPKSLSAEELATVTKRNRIVAEPYARMTVARDQVNQAAAIIIASAAKARELGVPEDRWVHIHAVTNAVELTPMQRPDLAAYPQAVASIDAALDIAGKTMDDIRYIDLYSCFAIPVFALMDAYDIAGDDSRGLTLTGGLPYFGGAGNNYSAHAIAEAVAATRDDPGSFALTGANGGMMSKYATGIYSTTPADWSAGSRWKTLDNPQTPLPIAEDYEGPATIVSYTVVPKGDAKIGLIIADTPDGSRIAAKATQDDAEIMDALIAGNAFGQTICISKNEKGRHIASLAA